MKPVYLDYAATTPLDPRVMERMQACLLLEGDFGNPSSAHFYGRRALEKVEEARAQVAALIQADPGEIIWTSGATESNNLAIKGAVALHKAKGRHIVTLKTEHKAVLDVCQHLEKEGYQVTYLTPLQSGLVDLQVFEAALRPDTVLVSCMLVNNETGIIQDIEKIAQITAEKNILLHVDAAQGVGKLALDLRKIPIDLLSLSAHKVYGPKGVGALYLRKKPRVRIQPLFHGGGHEQGMRSGTLPTHQIVGMGEAMQLAKMLMQDDIKRIVALRDQLLTGLQPIPHIKLNTHLQQSVPHILNLQFQGMLADALLAKLPQIAVATASACQARGTEGSYVLRAMGLTTDEIKSSLRFSFGRFTTKEEIEIVIKAIHHLFS